MNDVRLNVLHVLLEAIPAPYTAKSETGRVISMQVVMSWLFTSDIEVFKRSISEVFALIREGLATVIVIDGVNHLSIAPHAQAVLDEITRQECAVNNDDHGDGNDRNDYVAYLSNGDVLTVATGLQNTVEIALLLLHDAPYTECHNIEPHTANWRPMHVETPKRLATVRKDGEFNHVYMVALQWLTSGISYRTGVPIATQGAIEKAAFYMALYNVASNAQSIHNTYVQYMLRALRQDICAMHIEDETALATVNAVLHAFPYVHQYASHATSEDVQLINALLNYVSPNTRNVHLTHLRSTEKWQFVEINAAMLDKSQGLYTVSLTSRLTRGGNYNPLRYDEKSECAKFQKGATSRYDMLETISQGLGLGALYTKHQYSAKVEPDTPTYNHV